MPAAHRPASPPILLADIGGTHARFALAGADSAQPLLAGSVRAFLVDDFDSLAEAAERYLEGMDARPSRAVMAVAARIDGDTARMTNHRWVVSRSRLCTELGLESVLLVNDFVAQARAIPLLGRADLATIGAPALPRHDDGGDRTFAVAGAGTGLGVALLLRRDGRWSALATEGGHAGFAPATPTEIGILEQLAADFGRVSNERLVSGAGLVNLHRALGRIEGLAGTAAPSPEDVTARAASGDRLSRRAVEAFRDVFASVAGDLVLTFGAWDGIYLSGGLVPALLSVLQGPGFRERFEDKGRYASAMATVPALAVLHPQPGLLGAAALSGESS
ncbi:MAG: glucokinase [Pseudomonadota bacterium]|nr:glucokinase [Pseudomonadota bacterium]